MRVSEEADLFPLHHPERATECFREALEMDSPEPVRRRVAERVRDLEKRFAFQ